jgi:hypothetical protein
MPDPGAPTAGTLVKLLIEGYSDPTATSGLIGSVSAVINPETYTLSYNVTYEMADTIGSPAPTQIFASMGTGDFELELLADGTGVVPLPTGISNVDAYIAQVRSIVYDYQGDSHRPNYLRITWGKTVFTGVCKNITVKYTLFNPDGSALRALIKLSLSESVPFSTKAQEAGANSPDLTHMRTVKAGDTLPLMTYRIYGEAVHYMEVARVNGLNSIHDIKPGDELYFPPLKK